MPTNNGEKAMHRFLTGVVAVALAGSTAAGAAPPAAPLTTAQPAVETVLVLDRPVPLSAVAAVLDRSGARPIAFEHVAGERRGGFYSRRLATGDALRFYRESYARWHAGEPSLLAMRLDRMPSAADLGGVAVARALTVRPDDVVVVLGDGTIALNPRAVSDEDPTAPASVVPDVKAWAPERGHTTAYDDTDLCFPGIITCAQARGVDHYLSFDRTTPGDEFADDWVYEHDFKLFNPENWDTDYGICPSNQRNDFWADRNAGITWETTMPDPYLDTAVSDHCRYHDLTVGTYNPDKFVTRTYDINLVIAPGDHSDSEFQLRGEALEKDCEFSPWCVGAFGEREGGGGQLLVGSSKGVAPGCHRWAKGQDSQPC